MLQSDKHAPPCSAENGLPPRIEALARIIREEAGVILSLYPDAAERQWSASPVPKPREDTSQRASGDRPADPTADAVLDARRIAVRETVVRSEAVLRDAAIRLRAVREATERAIARFDGEG